MIYKVFLLLCIILALCSALAIPGHIKNKRYKFVVTGVIGIICMLIALCNYLFK